jgi:23S rRNA pseudouridine1911/1915/1917 synthase
MNQPPLDVLYEDNHLLVLNKPAGLATLGAAPGQPTLAALAKAYLKHRYQKPGNVYLGVVSRLDAWATGLVVLARTSKAAARLAAQFRDRTVRKTYWAIIPQPLLPPSGTWRDHLARHEPQRHVRLVAADDPAAQEALLRYRTIGPLDRGVLVEIELISGRKHQIRAQFAARGAPLLGDRKYGSTHPFGRHCIALHARRLVLVHPVRPDPLDLLAPLPGLWRSHGAADPAAGSQQPPADEP